MTPRRRSGRVTWALGGEDDEEIEHGTPAAGVRSRAEHAVSAASAMRRKHTCASADTGEDRDEAEAVRALAQRPHGNHRADQDDVP
ncbi:hypothetical protein PR202_gb19205 [Eleusine coracana subsp. coracana]|uniref:Uncharacterized protein n=1 Tax=Eleusine coracana subsp. coracana TaxID=191504 RepID=A0AAV5F920_ELECO|nr:hypothetical protein PR202_gb19205 [Eleusine coracana subsp. coracana]